MAEDSGHRSRHSNLPLEREGQEIDSPSVEERPQSGQAAAKEGRMNKHRHYYLNHRRKRPNGH